MSLWVPTLILVDSASLQAVNDMNEDAEKMLATLSRRLEVVANGFKDNNHTDTQSSDRIDAFAKYVIDHVPVPAT